MLRARQSIADVYMSQGQYEEAERLFRRVLQERQRLLGADDLDTLKTLQGIADVYRSQGRYEEAKQL
jgi:tetratricopeptide (TPR) repeat protein